MSDYFSVENIVLIEHCTKNEEILNGKLLPST